MTTLYKVIPYFIEIHIFFYKRVVVRNVIILKEKLIQFHKKINTMFKDSQIFAV